MNGKKVKLAGKRLLAIMLTIMMCFGCVDMTAFAADVQGTSKKETNTPDVQEPEEVMDSIADIQQEDVLEENETDIENSKTKENNAGTSKKFEEPVSDTDTVEESGKEETPDMLSVGKSSEVTVNSLEIQQMPDKVKYITGLPQNIRYEGLVIAVKLSDGNEDYVFHGSEYTDMDRKVTYDASAVNFDKAGIYPVLINCEGISVSYDVEVMTVPFYEMDESQKVTAFVPVNEKAVVKFTAPETGTFGIIASTEEQIVFYSMIEEFYDENGSCTTGGEYGAEDSMWYDLELEAGKTYYCVLAGTDWEDLNYIVTLEKKSKAVSAIMKSLPNRTTYITSANGNVLSYDFTGMVIEVTMEDGSQHTLYNGEAMPDGRGGGFRCNIFDWSQPTDEGIFTFSYDAVEVQVPFSLVEPGELIDQLEEIKVNDSKKNSLVKNETSLYKFIPDETGMYIIRSQDITGGYIYSTKVIDCAGNLLEEEYFDAIDSMHCKLNAGEAYIIQIEAGSQAVNFETTVIPAKEVTGLSIISPPEKTIYKVGEYPSYTGMEVQVNFTDGSSEIVSEDNYWYLSDGTRCTLETDFMDINIPGTYQVTIKVYEKEASTEFKVLSMEEYIAMLPQIYFGENDIELHESANNQEFGFTADEAGEYLFKIYGEEEEVYGAADLYNSSGECLDWVDIHSGALCSYMEEGESVYISLYSSSVGAAKIRVEKAKHITNVKVKSKPEQLIYVINGGSLNCYGMQVEVTYADGSKETVTDASIPLADGRNIFTNLNSIDWGKPGIYTVEIGNKDVTDSFDIQIVTEEEYMEGLQTVELGEELTMDLAEGQSIQEFKFTSGEEGDYQITLAGESGIVDDIDVLTYISGEPEWGRKFVYDDNTCTLYANRHMPEGVTSRVVLQRSNKNAGSIEVSIKKLKDISSVEIVKKPNRLVYLLGEKDYNLESKGLNVVVTFVDGTKETVTDFYEFLQDERSLEVDFDEVDWESPGTYPVKLCVGAAYDTFDIQILTEEEYLEGLPTLEYGKELSLDLKEGEQRKEFKFTSIDEGDYQITFTADRELLEGYNISTYLQNDYMFGDDFEKTDGSVRTIQISRHVEAGATVRVVLECSNSKAGVVRVNLKKLKNVSSVQILNKPEKLVYLLEEYSLDDSGLRTRVIYEDGSQETVTGLNVMLQDNRYLRYDTGSVDWSVPGTYPVKVQAGSVYDVFDIEILTEEDYLNRIENLEYGKELNLAVEEEQHRAEFKFIPEEEGDYLITLSGNSNLLNWDSDIRSYIQGKEDWNYNSDTSEDMYTANLNRHIPVGTACRVLVQNLEGKAGNIKVVVTKLKDISSIKIVKESVNKKFISGFNEMYTGSFWDMEVEVTYEDGTKEIIKPDEIGKDGRMLQIELPELRESGTYPVMISCGKAKASFEVTYLNWDDLYNIAPTLNLNTEDYREITLEARDYEVYKVQIPEDGYYTLLLKGSYVSYLSFYDIKNQSSINMSMKHDPLTEISQCILQDRLSAGTYYLCMQSQSDTAISYSLKLQKDKELKDIKIINEEELQWKTLVRGAVFDSLHNYVGYTVDMTVTYEDGTEENVTGDLVNVQDIDDSRPGEYILKYQYKDKIVDMKIQVVEPKDYQKTELVTSNSSYTIDVERYATHVYKFVPVETKKYYIDLYGDEIPYAARGIRLLSENGDVIASGNDGFIWEELEAGKGYYIAVSPIQYRPVQIVVCDKPLSITNEFAESGVEYTGQEIRPKVTVVYDGNTLTEGEDYTIEYTDNIKVGYGQAIAVPTGKVAFPEISTRFYIKAKNIKGLELEPIKTQAYTGDKICPKIVLKDGDYTLVEDVDYEVFFGSNVEEGTATVYIYGMYNYGGFIETTFEISKHKLGKIDYVMNGGENHPDNPVVSSNDKITLKNPERKGYEFEGWYTDDKFTDKITSIPGGNANDYTLYAKWEKIFVDTVVISKLVNSGTSALKVTFESIKGADGYLIAWAEDSKFTKNKDSLTTDEAGMVTISDLLPGRPYYVRIRAYKLDSTGSKVYGAYSANKSYKTAPEAPQISKLTGGSQKITIAWNKVDGAENYQVYMSTSKSGTYTRIATLNSDATSYAKSGLDIAKDYYFKVRAYNTAGTMKVYSSFGTIKCGTTSTSVPSISVKGGIKKAVISWDKVEGAEKYLIFKATSENGTYSKVDTVDGDTTSYTIVGLSAAKTYYFKVRTYRETADMTVYSSYSAVKSAGTATETPVINKVTGGANKITVAWDDVSGETKYELFMATSEDGTYSKIATLDADTQSYTKTGLSTAKTYYFKLRTYRTAGGKNVNSSYSSIKFGTTSTAVPTITSVKGGIKKAVVTWDKVTGASGYMVFMSTSANGTYSKIASVGSATASYTKTGLTSAQNYYFKVRAYRDVEGAARVYSSYSAYKRGGTATETPAISKVTGGANKITVAWDDVSGETKYVLYMATSKSGTYSKIATLNANTKSYTKTGLSTAKTYYFKLRTYRTIDGGTVYSSYSDIKYGTTSTSTPSIASVKGGVKKAVITWNKVTGADGYIVYMSTSADGTYSSIANVDSTVSSYTKTGLSSAKNYYFKVRAYRNGEGTIRVYSSYSTVKWTGTATATPAISEVASGENQITVSWNNVSGESKYILYMATSQNGTYSKIATLGTNVCSYTKVGLKAGSTYYFKVRTYRTVNGSNIYSSYSAVERGIPQEVETVYVTQTGKCYHLAGCSTIKRSKNLREMTKSEAEKEGFDACDVCNP